MFTTLYSVSSCLSAKPAFRGTLCSVIGSFYNSPPGISPGCHRTSTAFLAHPRTPGGTKAGAGRGPRPHRAPFPTSRGPLATPPRDLPHAPSSSPGLPWLHADGARSAARTDSATSSRTCPASSPEAPTQPVCAGCPRRCLSASRHRRGFPPHNIRREKNH